MRKVIKYLPFLIIWMTSCKRDLKHVSWDSDLAVPIANTSLGLSNIINDSIIKIASDNSLKFVYNTSLYKINYDTLMKMPDTTVSNGYRNVVNLNFNPGQQVYGGISNTRYALGDAQLNTIIIKKGKIKFRVKSTVKEKIVFNYKMPCATKDGSFFSINETIPAGTSTQLGVFEKEYDMAGYTINLKGQNNNSYNTIYYDLSAKIDPNGNPVLVTYYDSLRFENTFTDLYPLYAKGYFGKQTIHIGPETTDFSLFKQIIGGNIALEDVKLDLTLKNGIGVDASAIIKKLYSLNTRTGNNVFLNNSIIGANTNLNRATETGNWNDPINYSYKQFSMDNSNSNLRALVENIPDRLGYEMDLTINPYGNVSAGNDFIYFDYPLETNLSMEIPANFGAGNLCVVDTASFDLSAQKESNRLNSGAFHLIAANGFPFDAEVQLYFLNEQNQRVDSLATNNRIAKGLLNSSNIVYEKKKSMIDLPLSHEKIDKLFSTKKILIKVIFNTNNYPQLYKIYKDYNIDVTLTGQFNYSIGKKK